MSPHPGTSTGTAPATGPRPGPAPATAPGTATDRACDRCVARSWLLARLSAHLELARGQVEPVLGLDDEELLAALGGKRRAAIWSERQRLDLRQERRHAASAGLELICRCDQSYPARLACSPSPPAVLHVAGGLERFLGLVAGDPVAIVGARTPSAYGLEMATLLGRGLGRAGLTVISGMALGIDSAAHAGALAGEGGTVAVLPGGADQPYPASKRLLHRQIQGVGAAVSELPPGAVVRRWCFPARNRIVAGLSAMTVVVEAGEGSGALLTAAFSQALGRPIGAVPGRVTSPLAAGANRLLATGAQLVSHPQDVLDRLFGAGVRAAVVKDKPELQPELRLVLTAIADGEDTTAALSRGGLAAEQGLAAVAALELAGYVRREAGGRFTVLP